LCRRCPQPLRSRFRHFLAETLNALAEMIYSSVLNDHLTDGSHPEAPYNKLASGHGQIMVHLQFADQAGL
jgi:hypothetical protein